MPIRECEEMLMAEGSWCLPQERRLTREKSRSRLVNDVEARHLSVPARKSCCSMHEDSSLLLTWLHGSIDC